MKCHKIHNYCDCIFGVCWCLTLTAGIHFPPKWLPHSGHVGGLWRVTYTNEHPGFRHLPRPLRVYVFTDCKKRRKHGSPGLSTAITTSNHQISWIVFSAQARCLPVSVLTFIKRKNNMAAYHFIWRFGSLFYAGSYRDHHHWAHRADTSQRGGL